MAGIYDRMNLVSQRLHGRFKQGTVEYVETIEEPGAEPWDPVTQTLVRYPMDAVAVGGGVKNGLVQTGQILSSDLLISCSQFDVVPEVGGIVEINSVQYQIIMLESKTIEAGVPIAYTIGLRK